MKVPFSESQIKRADQYVGGNNTFTRLLLLAQPYRELSLPFSYVYDTIDGTLELKIDSPLN